MSACFISVPVGGVLRRLWLTFLSGSLFFKFANPEAWQKNLSHHFHIAKGKNKEMGKNKKKCSMIKTWRILITERYSMITANAECSLCINSFSLHNPTLRISTEKET